MLCQASVLMVAAGSDGRLVAPTCAAGGGAASAFWLEALGLSAEGAARDTRRLEGPPMPLPALLIMALLACEWNSQVFVWRGRSGSSPSDLRERCLRCGNEARRRWTCYIALCFATGLSVCLLARLGLAN